MGVCVCVCLFFVVVFFFGERGGGGGVVLYESAQNHNEFKKELRRNSGTSPVKYHARRRIQGFV